MKKNWKKSSGKRNGAIGICYFFMKGHIKEGNLEVEYCTTEETIADFMIKLL